MIRTCLTGVLFVGMVITYADTHAADAARPSRPNIVFMLADDQAWNGLSVAMAPDVPASRGEQFQTPALERLAVAGMRFSAAYSPAPVCSPTRISLQTGMSPARLHWTKAAPREQGHRLLEPQNIRDIPGELATIAELLRRVGYATAHYGKWHIGGGGPGNHGYDEHDGDTGNEHAYQFTDPNPVDIFGMAARTASFMEKSKAAGRPFFVQLSWNALHAAQNARKATLAKYGAMGDAVDKRIATLAITEDLDEGVGRVLAAIDRLGIADNTFVVYMSDNGGGGGKRGGLSGGKGSVWEGGIRVPLIIRGPGVQAASWCHVPVVGYDLFPTFCTWAGVPGTALPKDLDGGSIAGLIAAGGRGHVRRDREEIVFHFPHYQSSDGPQAAIRVGDMKLISFFETGEAKLFDLSRDLGEQTDLAAARPAVAAELRKRLNAHLTLVQAQLPSPNPDFDPSQPPPQVTRGQKGLGGQKKGMLPEGAMKQKSKPKPQGKKPKQGAKA
jgi:arylsulfatase A